MGQPGPRRPSPRAPHPAPLGHEQAVFMTYFISKISSGNANRTRLLVYSASKGCKLHYDSKHVTLEKQNECQHEY